jgi:hypothetical protein
VSGLRIKHEQLLAFCRDLGTVVMFGVDGCYECAHVRGLVFRPVPAVAYPHDWPDWRLDLEGSVAQQGIDPLPTDAEPPGQLSGAHARVARQADALAASLALGTQQTAP